MRQMRIQPKRQRRTDVPHDVALPFARPPEISEDLAATARLLERIDATIDELETFIATVTRQIDADDAPQRTRASGA